MSRLVLFFLLVLVQLNIINSQLVTKYSVQYSTLKPSIVDELIKSPVSDATKLNADYLSKTDSFKSSLMYDSLKPRVGGTIQFEPDWYKNLTIQFGYESTAWFIRDYNQLNKGRVAVKKDSTKIHDMSSLNAVRSVIIHPYHKEFVIFTAHEQENKLFISPDNARTIKTVRIEFDPDLFYFTNELNKILAVDRSGRQLWLTIDSGFSWKQISSNVVKISTSSVSIDDIYFMERNDTKTHLIRFDLKQLNTQVVERNILDFVAVNGRIYTLIQTNKGLTLMTSTNNEDFQMVKLKEVSGKIIDFDVSAIKENEAFIIVKSELNSQVTSDLYHSLDFINFEKSLQNIVYNCPERNELKYVMKIGRECAQIKSLSPSSSAYVANSMNGNKLESFIKMSLKDEWESVDFWLPSDKGLSLELSDYLLGIYKQPKYSGSNLLDLIISRTNRPVSNGNSLTEVYVSRDEGYEWEKIKGLNSNYLYSISMHNKIPVIIAVEANKPTNKILYSYDRGYEWNEFYFSNRLVIVDKIINIPESQASFYLPIQAYVLNEPVKSIIRIDFKKSFDLKEEDEKEPTPIIDESIRDSINEHSHDEIERISISKETRKNLIMLLEFSIPGVVLILGCIFSLYIWLRYKEKFFKIFKKNVNKSKNEYARITKRPIIRDESKHCLINEADQMV